MAKGNRLVWTILAGALIWLFLSGIAVLTLWPSIPATRMGWVVAIIIGPPLYLAAEFLAERIGSSKAAQALDENPSRSFRIVAGVLVGIVYVAIVMIVSHLFGANGA